MKEYHYKEIKNRFYPLIPVSFYDQEVNTFALVDSGSMISLFQEEVAKQLRINIKLGIPKHLQGVGGRILVYLHQIPIEVAGKRFNCQIAFSEEYGASFNILARKDFFELFRIIFEEKNKMLILKEID